MAAEEWPCVEGSGPVLGRNKYDGDRQVSGVAFGSAGEPDVGGAAAIGGEVREPVYGVGFEEPFESSAVHPDPGQLGMAGRRSERCEHSACLLSSGCACFRIAAIMATRIAACHGAPCIAAQCDRRERDRPPMPQPRFLSECPHKSCGLGWQGGPRFRCPLFGGSPTDRSTSSMARGQVHMWPAHTSRPRASGAYTWADVEAVSEKSVSPAALRLKLQSRRCVTCSRNTE